MHESVFVCLCAFLCVLVVLYQKELTAKEIAKRDEKGRSYWQQYRSLSACTIYMPVCVHTCGRVCARA